MRHLKLNGGGPLASKALDFVSRSNQTVLRDLFQLKAAVIAANYLVNRCFVDKVQ